MNDDGNHSPQGLVPGIDRRVERSLSRHAASLRLLEKTTELIERSAVLLAKSRQLLAQPVLKANPVGDVTDKEEDAPARLAAD